MKQNSYNKGGFEKSLANLRANSTFWHLVCLALDEALSNDESKARLRRYAVEQAVGLIPVCFPHLLRGDVDKAKRIIASYVSKVFADS